MSYDFELDGLSLSLIDGEVSSRLVEIQVEMVFLAKERDKADLHLRELQARRAGLVSRQNELLAIPQDTQRNLWCADLTEDLSGAVGTVEIPGEGDTRVIIKPGYSGEAGYVCARDGQLHYRAGQSPAQAFFNAAILPGWQRFKPTYRVGTLTAVDDAADTGSVSLDAEVSSAQSLPINQAESLSDIPIVYMDCNADAFEVGDRVLVEFVGQDWAAPRIIGFESEPKECCIEEWRMAQTDGLGERFGSVAWGADGVWVATSVTYGLYRSVDDGRTWTQLGFLGHNLMRRLMWVDTDRAGVWIAVSYSGHMARSTDNGETWVVLDQWGATAEQASDPYILAPRFTCCATDGDGTWVVTDWGGLFVAKPQMLRSNDNGETWFRWTPRFYYDGLDESVSTTAPPAGEYDFNGLMFAFVRCERNGTWVFHEIGVGSGEVEGASPADMMFSVQGLDAVFYQHWADHLEFTINPDAEDPEVNDNVFMLASNYKAVAVVNGRMLRAGRANTPLFDEGGNTTNGLSVAVHNMPITNERIRYGTLVYVEQGNCPLLRHETWNVGGLQNYGFQFDPDCTMVTSGPDLRQAVCTIAANHNGRVIAGGGTNIDLWQSAAPDGSVALSVSGYTNAGGGYILESHDDGEHWARVPIPMAGTVKAAACNGETWIAVGHQGIMRRCVKIEA